MGSIIPLRDSETFQSLTGSAEPAATEEDPDCWCKGNDRRARQAERIPQTGLIEYRYCPCAIGDELHEKDRAEIAERRRQAIEDRIFKRRENAAIPFRYQEATLSAARTEHSDIVARLRGELPKYREFGSWYFHGKAGTGKTWLACACLNDAIIASDGFLAPLFITLPDLLGKLRSSYQATKDGESEEDIIQRMLDAGALLLDDVGAEAVSNRDWAADRLYRIIGGRYNAESSTIFTSNMSIKELAEWIGPRIVGRMVEMIGEDHIIEVPGPNLRLKK